MSNNISFLENALKSLEDAILEYKKDNRDFIKDSIIQRFEYTYELSWKTLKRHISSIAPQETEIAQMSFADLIRTANQYGLLMSDWSVWIKYRESRNLTAHTYDYRKADEVMKIIPQFCEEIKFLLKKLENVK